MDYRGWPWLIAVCIMALTPLALLFGAEPLRVGVALLLEFVIAALVSRWSRTA